jgi:predicted MPP superfamily phosphohydrolase
MSIFHLIVGTVLLGDLAWWLWGDRLLRRTKRHVLWRSLLGLFAGAQLGYILWMLTFPIEARQGHAWLPVWAMAGIYIWHLLILPIGIVIMIGWGVGSLVRRIVRRINRRREEGVQVEDFRLPARRKLSRREALVTAAAVAIPPLLTGGAVGWSVPRLRDFRIRRIDVPLAALPPQLDGVTIAHVSDVHVGRFTRASMLDAIADATNALKADLVLLTGDLIDLSLSDLPAGIDFVRKLDPRSGLFTCEGNHDLIENRYAFESRMKEAGMPLLLDQQAIVALHDQPVQILGLTWGRTNADIVGSMSRLSPWRRSDAFQILLAHHPHVFDAAAAVGIPLTLAGHTHGGQLMLNERLGAGPVMFKYWSGLYRRPSDEHGPALVVSNGVGNWFPLRTNAPAEIVHITLRSAAWEPA